MYSKRLFGSVRCRLDLATRFAPLIVCVRRLLAALSLFEADCFKSNRDLKLNLKPALVKFGHLCGDGNFALRETSIIGLARVGVYVACTNWRLTAGLRHRLRRHASMEALAEILRMLVSQLSVGIDHMSSLAYAQVRVTYAFLR